MWDRLTCVTPAANVVSDADAMAHLRIDDAGQASYVNRIVAAAQAVITGPRGIGVALGPSTWRLSLDRWPGMHHHHASRDLPHGGWVATHPHGFGPVIEIPLTPVTAVQTLTYVDTDGVTQTLVADTDYLVDLDRRPARIVPAPGACWPGTRLQPGAIKITFDAGDEAPPPDLVQAILLMTGHLFENREAVISGQRTVAIEVPLGVKWLLERHHQQLLA